MDRQQKKRGTNRLRSGESFLPSKRSTLNTKKELTSVKLTDLNDDCLIMILDFLDIQSLFNLALSSDSLIPIAQYIYHRKLSKKTVIIRKNTSLQFIRCFGPVLTKVKIAESRPEEHFDMVHKFLNDYCAKNLISVTYVEESFFPKECVLLKYPKKYFPKKYSPNPFIKVENVRFVNAYLGDQWRLLNKWFPNLRSLELINCGINYNFIVTTFGHLNRLSIEEEKKNRTVQVVPFAEERRKYRIERERHNSLRFALANPSLIDIYTKNIYFEEDDIKTLTRQLNFSKTFQFDCVYLDELDVDHRPISLEDSSEWKLTRDAPFSLLLKR